jgi:hypothetical protein
VRRSVARLGSLQWAIFSALLSVGNDLGAELSEAARWYAGEAEMQAFLAHIRAGHLWSERRPRRLLAWADRQAVPVFGARRFVTVLLAGFDGLDRWRLWRAAKAELRRAREAIARGEETGMIYAGGRDLLVFGEGKPRRWGAPESVLRPSAGPLPETTEATSPSLPNPPSSPPKPPRGTSVTRAENAGPRA